MTKTRLARAVPLPPSSPVERGFRHIPCIRKMLRVVVLSALLVCMGSVPAESRGQDALRELNASIARLAESVTPGVVQVQSNSYEPAGRVGDPRAVAIQSNTGSGVILSSDGLIVTNAHVVSGARRVQVQLAFLDGPPGQSVVRPRGRRLPAEVIGIDLETDLALLKADARDLPVLALADSEQLRQGQLVLAFGSPLGLENSVSMGVVSSVARQLEPDDRMIYIQTDAPINPGNSGGPLVDVEGKVVGINTMIFSQSGGSNGLGFAVPSNIVRSVVGQLRENGVFTRGEIGVEAQTVTPELAAGLGINREYGVILSDVFPGGPAYEVDLRIGDIVLSLNGKTMENARQFLVNLYGLVPNGVVRLELLRGDEQISKSVTVRVQPDEPERVARLFDKQQRLVPRLGILGVAVADGVREFIPVLRRPDGILVTNLASAAGAPRGLFLPGDVIYSINSQILRSMGDLEATLAEYDAGDSAVLQVERRGRLSYIVVQLY